MSFGDAIRTCFRKYVDFSGRAPRSEFWWWILFVLLANIVLAVIDSVVFGVTTTSSTGFETSTDFAPLSSLFGLAVLLPNLAVTVRRLHDGDRTGWWVLAPYGLALLGAALVFVTGTGSGSILMVISGIMFIVLLVWMIMKGTDGPNRFGPDPLGGDGGGPDLTYSASSIPQIDRDD